MHRPAPIPTNDGQRVAFLQSLNILDTQAEKAFDRITEAASTITHSPIALVSLVDSDRQWFKSRVGLDVSETSRDLAFCAHVIAQRGNGMFVVNDALEDERFKHNDLVLGEPRIRFYAGVPLVLESMDGTKHKIGTLCIIDRTPRELQDYHYIVMQSLAQLVVSRITTACQGQPSVGHCSPLVSSSVHWPAATRTDVQLIDDPGDCIPLSPTDAEDMWRRFLRRTLTADGRCPKRRHGGGEERSYDADSDIGERERRGRCRSGSGYV